MNDPRQQLFDRSSLSEEDLEQLDRLFESMGRLRDVERQVLESSRAFMQLNETDMRALQYIISRQNQGEAVSPRRLAEFLRITTASTTKLIDRLEDGGHLHRAPHPTDRRALILTVSEQTHAAAMGSMGRIQAARIPAAVELTPQERETVIRFISRTAQDMLASIAPATANGTGAHSATPGHSPATAPSAHPNGATASGQPDPASADPHVTAETHAPLSFDE